MTRHTSVVKSLCSFTICCALKISTMAENQRDSYEARIQAALQAVTTSGLNPRGQPIYSLRRAAEDHEIVYSTLQLRWKGGNTWAQAVEAKMILTLAEEAILVEWIKAMARRGLGWSPEIIMDAAARISGKSVGLAWLALFRKRHEDIKFLQTRGLEACRAQCLNRTQVTQFYDVLEEVYSRLGATADRVYNMDEKGVQLGVGGRKGVMVDAGQKTVYHIENGNREMVTCIECVCADGTALRTMHIYKGQGHDLEWGRDNPFGAR